MSPSGATSALPEQEDNILLGADDVGGLDGIRAAEAGMATHEEITAVCRSDEAVVVDVPSLDPRKDLKSSRA